MEFCAIAHIPRPSTCNQQHEKTENAAPDTGEWAVKRAQQRGKLIAQDFPADEDTSDDPAGDGGDRTEAHTERKDGW